MGGCRAWQEEALDSSRSDKLKSIGEGYWEGPPEKVKALYLKCFWLRVLGT